MLNPSSSLLADLHKSISLGKERKRENFSDYVTSSFSAVLGCLVGYLFVGKSTGVCCLFVGLAGVFPVVVLGWVLMLQKVTGNESVQEVYLQIFKRCLKRSKSEVLKEKSVVRTILKLSNLTTFFHYMHYSVR